MKSLVLSRTYIAFHILSVLVSGLGVALFLTFVYYIPRLDRLNRQISIMNSSLETQRDQIEIMRQSLERKAQLIMTVVPSYTLTVIKHRNGTVEERQSTLTLSRTKNFTFTIYVSNVGDAFAHLLYYSVILTWGSKHTVTSVYSMETIVLKPNESTTFEYVFEPSNISTEILFSSDYFNLTFGLGSAEASIYKVVNAQF